MPIVCTPEVGIPLPVDTTPEEVEDFRERAHALFATMQTILPPDTKITVTPEEKALAHELVEKKVMPANSTLTTGLIANLESVLTKYDYEIIGVANKIRNYVTNKLIEESTSSNDKHRMRALELLGKMSNVRIFSENVNVNVTHRSVQSIEEDIRKTLRMYSSELLTVTDVDILENVKHITDIDINEELGEFDGPATPT